MNKSAAITEIKRVFGAYKAITANEDAWLRRLKGGKLYEMYCLSKVLEILRAAYGFRVSFNGSTIIFQSSPGRINRNMPYFSISSGRGPALFELFTDVEFETFGVSTGVKHDNSARHEIDLLIVENNLNGWPSHDKIILGVECKSHACFKKSIVKEVLGIRRELSLLTQPVTSRLAQNAPNRPSISVPADPPSEYWLAFVDSRGSQYRYSPGAFGISFYHWQP